MFRHCLLLFSLLLLAGCAADLPPGAQRITLDQEISASRAVTYQVYYGLVDTAAWEATVAAADTTIRRDNFWKFRSNRIWYEISVDADSTLRSEQHYPGWERMIDSVEVTNNVIYSNRWQRLTARIPAADVLLGPDSVRIAVAQITGKAFAWQNFELKEPDYLILFPPGEDSVPISLNLSNIGPISSQTIFRVGRQQYALTYVSDDRREIVIEPYRGGPVANLTAELDPIYRAAPALDSDREPTRIKRRDGKELVLFFTGTHPGSTEILQKLDSAYLALPAARREKTDVAIVIRNFFFSGSTETLLSTDDKFLRDLNVSLPVYISDDRTCERLVCRPYLPYYIHVNDRGRLTTLWGKPDNLGKSWFPNDAAATK
ncbi:hypothetical protein [Lewinella sp. 4G2]|uniref:hypothetical protein n=1 Tax=Lewinella sp. 4G2 TaxID=1803372 RepID=UPI0007B4BAEC|nr:hypothetical protein [Lewinella sp. 4G2]OAV43400.1 hypothetical protein A3850_002310 [Lewinella sp. 4G2]